MVTTPQLWISYCVSVIFVLLAIFIGVFALLLNAESYSNDFSTNLRVSRTAELSVKVMEKDRSGRDPLPTYLQDARLDLRANTRYPRLRRTRRWWERLKLRCWKEKPGRKKPQRRKDWKMNHWKESRYWPPMHLINEGHSRLVGTSSP
jgi:hypothetical protein